jgi:uncharacterized membrane protein
MTISEDDNIIIIIIIVIIIITIIIIMTAGKAGKRLACHKEKLNPGNRPEQK